MADVTDTIGATGRDFTTMTLWEASLSAHSGDNCTGECYDDSDFDEAVTIDDGTPLSIALTVAAGERHNGTEKSISGSGVRNLRSGNADSTINVTSAKNVTVSWLEIDVNGNQGSNVVKMVGANGFTHTHDHLIVHGISDPDTAAAIFQEPVGGATTKGHNTLVYDVKGTGTTYETIGISAILGHSSRISHLFNCTIHDVKDTNAGSTKPCYGIEGSNYANAVVKNVVVTDVTNAGSGSVACFSGFGGTSTTATNASTDSTAPSPIGAEPVVSSAEYVSTVGGSENLHLKAGAECINAGTDLGTTPTGVNIDIDGRDRDAEGDTWDVGADEYVAAAGRTTKNTRNNPLGQAAGMGFRMTP